MKHSLISSLIPSYTIRRHPGSSPTVPLPPPLQKIIWVYKTHCLEISKNKNKNKTATPNLATSSKLTQPFTEMTDCLYRQIIKKWLKITIELLLFTSKSVNQLYNDCPDLVSAVSDMATIVWPSSRCTCLYESHFCDSLQLCHSWTVKHYDCYFLFWAPFFITVCSIVICLIRWYFSFVILSCHAIRCIACWGGTWISGWISSS